MNHIAGGSSQHVVESNDDLLSEILICLPVISILVFKSVSKRWLSIIKSPNFTLQHRTQIRNLNSASGLYLGQPGSYSAYDFVPLDNRMRVSRSPSKIILDGQIVIILQSCNGLLLCRGDFHFLHYVYNPTTDMFKKLPPCPISFGIMRMAYDPTKSPHYKLVNAIGGGNRDLDFNIRIFTYFSETGIWSDCGDRYWSPKILSIFNYGIYWSNAIHWVDGSSHNKLCLGRLDITSVQAPVIVDGKQCFDRKLFESRGCLLLVCVYADYTQYFGQLYVYEMSSNGQSKWSIKYIVDLDEPVHSFPEIWRRPNKWVSTSVWCLVLGEKEEDTFMVIELYGKVIQYKIMSNTLRELRDFKSHGHCPISFQFIASFADVR